MLLSIVVAKPAVGTNNSLLVLVLIFAAAQSINGTS